MLLGDLRWTRVARVFIAIKTWLYLVPSAMTKNTRCLRQDENV